MYSITVTNDNYSETCETVLTPKLWLTLCLSVNIE